MKKPRTPTLEEQNRFWKRELEKSGFDDIEDSKERLKNPDNRTIAFENRDKIRDFFLSLDALLTHYKEMPKFERQVMELYSRGIYVRTIVRTTKRSDRLVRNVIKRYKGLVMAINRLNDNADFPPSLNPQSDVGSGAMDANHETEDQAA